MSRIRGKDTTPEKIVRSMLHRMGYRFRLHARIPLPGTAAVSKTSRSAGKDELRSTTLKTLGSIASAGLVLAHTAALPALSPAPSPPQTSK